MTNVKEKIVTGINWKKEFLGKNWGRIKYKGQKLTNFKKIVFGPKKQVGAELKEKWVWGPKIENFQKKSYLTEIGTQKLFINKSTDERRCLKPSGAQGHLKYFTR